MGIYLRVLLSDVDAAIILSQVESYIYSAHLLAFHLCGGAVWRRQLVLSTSVGAVLARWPCTSRAGEPALVLCNPVGAWAFCSLRGDSLRLASDLLCTPLKEGGEVLRFAQQIPVHRVSLG